MSDERKVLLEKRKEVAPDRNLGGSFIAKVNGINVTETNLTYCNVCGHNLDVEKESVVCRLDKKVVCLTCSVFIDQTRICFDCLKSTRPVSKQEYKVLICIEKRLKNGSIHNLTKISKSDIREDGKFLRRAGYVVKRILRGYEITDRGIDIIGAYRQVYDRDEDIRNLRRELDEI